MTLCRIAELLTDGMVGIADNMINFLQKSMDQWKLS